MCNGSTNKTARVQFPTTYPRFIVHYLDAGYFSCFLSPAVFFKIISFENSFRNTFKVSNGLDPDQARQFVGHDLFPNCLQGLSADDYSRH